MRLTLGIALSTTLSSAWFARRWCSVDLRFAIGVITSLLIGYTVQGNGSETKNFSADLTDSDALVDDIPMWWIDNHRVFFRGYDQKQRRDSEQPIYTNQYSFYIWDTRSNRLKRVDRPMSNLQCVNEGRVAFYAPDPEQTNGDWVLYVGKYGSEKNTKISRQEINARRAWLNPVSCRIHKTEPPWIRLAPRFDDVRFLAATKPMKEEHGFIYVGPGGSNSGIKQGEYEVVLYRAQDGKNVTLFQHSDDNARGIVLRLSYVPFIEKYLLAGTTKLIGEGIAPAWFVSSSGDVEPITPSKVPTPGADNYLPTRVGLIYPYIRVTDRLDISVNGIWLIRGDQIERIVVGIVRGSIVSPDGCRAAFSHAIHHQAHYEGLASLRRGGFGYTTLKMVDLCSSREAK